MRREFASVDNSSLQRRWTLQRNHCISSHRSRFPITNAIAGKAITPPLRVALSKLVHPAALIAARKYFSTCCNRRSRSVRKLTSSFTQIRFRWLLNVFMLKPNFVAICRFVRPRAASNAFYLSGGVSSLCTSLSVSTSGSRGLG
jgi:hypothetical protein